MPKKLFFLGAQNNRCEHFSTCVTNHSTRKIFSTDMQKPLWLLCFFWPYLAARVFHIKKSIPFSLRLLRLLQSGPKLTVGITKIGFSRNRGGASYFLSFVHTSYMAPAWLFHPFFKFPPMRTKSDLEPTQLDEGGAWDKKGDVQNPMMWWYF